MEMTFNEWNDVKTKMCFITYVLLLYQWYDQILDGITQCMQSTPNPNDFIWRFQFQCAMFVSEVLKRNFPNNFKDIDLKFFMRNNCFNIDSKQHGKWGTIFIREFIQNQHRFDQWWDEQKQKNGKNVNPLLMKLVKLCLEHIAHINDLGLKRVEQSTKNKKCMFMFSACD